MTLPILAHRLQDACAQGGRRPAAADAGRSLSYADFARLGNSWGAQLAAAGLKAHEPVLIAVSNQAADLAAFFAVWVAKGVAVPVHRAALPATAADIAARTGARFAVNAVHGLPAPPPFRTVDPVIALRAPPPPRRPLLEGAALVVYTSGTTGAPKGVVIAHDRFSRKLDAIQSRVAYRAGELTVLPLNLTFIFGQWASLLSLITGGTVRLVDRFDPAGFPALLANGATRTALVPTMVRLIQPALEESAARPFAGTVMLGGEVLPATLAHRIADAWPDASFWNLYGLTETGSCDFFVGPDDFLDKAGTIGVAGAGVDHRIDAPADGAAGPGGELQIRSPYAMNGYLDDPGTTAAAFTGDGWFRTGDIARERADGAVELVGRSKELVNRGGVKISPVQVEACFLAHPKVQAALATGVPDPARGEALHVMVVPAKGAILDIAELTDWARRRLDGPMRPDAYHVAADLPRGRTGKTDRGALRAQIVQQEAG